MSTTTPPRRRWPWILIGTIALIAVVLGAYLIGTRSGDPVETTTPTATESTGPTDIPTTDAVPTGCLGGPARDADMILSAQAEAPRTTAGAVEVAAAFTRWIQRFPLPDSREAGAVGAALLAEDSFTSDLSEYLAGSPDLSGGIVPPGTDYYLSTVPGVWYLDSANDDTVEASIGAGYVIDGELSASLSSSITVTLEWSDEGWRIADATGTRATEDLFDIGTGFSGGC